MKFDSGLELILPGMYYDIMKSYQNLIKQERVQEVGFAGMKREFIKDNDFKIFDAT